MAKNFLSTQFQKLGTFLKKLAENAVPNTRDALTLTDEFAKAAFKQAGFVVESRESDRRVRHDAFTVDGCEATYVLRKEQDDGTRYTAEVSTVQVITGSCYAGLPVVDPIITKSWVSKAATLKA